MPLGRREVSGILPRGGTILGTTRSNPYKVEGGVEAVLENFAANRLDALVVVGGEDTLGVAARLHSEHALPVVGVPKTIDNDLSGTDYTFGFDTAVTIATEAIDRLHTTAESHNRVMVVEVMGRHTGWIAVMSGIAGGADVILIPEQAITVEDACRELVKRHEAGKDFSIVVVSEGYELTYESGEHRLVAGVARESDQFGHVVLGGVGEALGRDIEERTGFETRVTVLGHVQRGGTPTPRDRVLATQVRAPRRGPGRAAELRSHGRTPGRQRRRHPARGCDPRAQDRARRVVRRRARVLRLVAASAQGSWADRHTFDGESFPSVAVFRYARSGWSGGHIPPRVAGSGPDSRPLRLGLPPRARATIRQGRSGGTGRRAGLKIPCPSGRVGSTPTSGIARSVDRYRGATTWPEAGFAGREASRRDLRATGRRRGLVGEPWVPPRKTMGSPR